MDLLKDCNGATAPFSSCRLRASGLRHVLFFEITFFSRIPSRKHSLPDTRFEVNGTRNAATVCQGARPTECTGVLNTASCNPPLSFLILMFFFFLYLREAGVLLQNVRRFLELVSATLSLVCRTSFDHHDCVVREKAFLLHDPAVLEPEDFLSVSSTDCL